MTRQAHANPGAAEKAFYAAFVDCDIEAMRSIWSGEDALCVHPGAAPLLGYAAVLRSWEHIFDGAVMPRMQVRVLHRIVGDDLAIHLVEERIANPSEPGADALVLATNTYRRLPQGWLMVAHQGTRVTQAKGPAPTLQ